MISIGCRVIVHPEPASNPAPGHSALAVNTRKGRLSLPLWLQLSAAIECLELIRSLAGMYLEERGASSGYLDFLARLFPREAKRSSIVMP